MDKELKEKEDWGKLRPLLQQDYNYNIHWAKAIGLFNNRLNRKFFTPVKTIIKHQKLEGEGFAILTVQCALIESLASFRTGEIYTWDIPKGAPKYLYNKSKKMFVDFLHFDDIFKDNFWQYDKNGGRIKDKPFNAGDFYSNVRCGLMHEARTIGKWHINATKKKVKEELIFIEQEGEKIKVLRSILHYRLKRCVKEYIKDLKQQDENGNKLRRFFARKLDHLYDISLDPKNYDWWLDK